MPEASSNAPIAAVATAPGVGGVAVIRLSGAGVYAIADALTRLSPPPSARAPGTFAYAKLLGEAGEVLDDALLLFFRAPHSYTGEDTIELCCHGSPVITARVLERLWQLGATPAGPGEFTRRAFLNGRLDLTQAEAVADLIAARTPRAERAARANLQGRLGTTLAPLYEETLALSADLEHALDFEEGELPEDFFGALGERLSGLEAQLAALRGTWREARLVREGALVVIAGKPNAGKSTLLNLLLGYNRAIVSDEPGTTRDAIEEPFLLDGVPLRLTDTAGLREAPGAIEREGVARARDLLERADVVLYLAAADDPSPEPPPAGALALLTKCELAPNAPLPPGFPPEAARISALADPAAARERVCALLRQALALSAGETDHAALANERQLQGVTEAHAALLEAQGCLARGELGYVPAAQTLRRAAEALGQLLGRVYSDDLLDTVFSRFCVGK